MLHLCLVTIAHMPGLEFSGSFSICTLTFITLIYYCLDSTKNYHQKINAQSHKDQSFRGILLYFLCRPLLMLNRLSNPSPSYSNKVGKCFNRFSKVEASVNNNN